MFARHGVDSFQDSLNIAATVLMIGAENGCLKFATADESGAGFDGAQRLLVRNWYVGFRVGLLVFICRGGVISASNPSWAKFYGLKRSQVAPVGKGSYRPIVGIDERRTNRCYASIARCVQRLKRSTLSALLGVNPEGRQQGLHTPKQVFQLSRC